MNEIIVLKITLLKNKKYKIDFSNDEQLSLDEDLFTDYYFYAGKKITQIEYDELKNKVKYHEDYLYVIRLLSKNDYSSKTIKDKLKYIRHLDDSKIDEIISKLVEKNLVNDIRYQEELIELLESKKYGYHRIVQELKDNGLDVDVYQYDEDKENDKILKCYNETKEKCLLLNHSKRKKYLINHLLNLGFDMGLINLVINEESIDEEKELELLNKDYIKITQNLKKELKREEIIKKLLNKGYHYNDIKKVLGD